MEKTIDEMIKEDCDKAIANAIVNRAEQALEYLDAETYLFENNFKLKTGGVNIAGPGAVLNNQNPKKIFIDFVEYTAPAADNKLLQ